MSFGALKADAEIAVALRLAPGTLVHHAERVWEEESTPIGLLISYIVLRIARVWSETDLTENTIMRLLLRSHVPIERGEQRFSAINADARQATLLKIKRGTALLKAERTLFTAKDKPIEYAISLFRPDRYEPELAFSGEVI